MARVISPQASSRYFCKNPRNKTSSPIGAKRTMVNRSNIKDKGFSGVRSASTWRNESGIGRTKSTNKLISLEIIMAPIDSKMVE